jgi:hypothetical protein
MGTVRAWSTADTFTGDVDTWLVEFIGSVSYQKTFTETLRLGEVVSVTATTQTQINISEGIEITDVISEKIQTLLNCIPWSGWGGTGWYPTIVLVRKIGSGSWEAYKSYIFSKQDEPRDNWKYNVIQLKPPTPTAADRMRLFPVKYQPGFEIGARADYCNQELTTFLLDYTAFWLESCPHDGTEDRKILYYALGLSQQNRYGDSCGPVEVYFEENPLSVIERTDGNRGRYLHTLRMLSMNFYKAAIIDTIIPTDYNFNYDPDDEIERHIGGIVPWGDAI